MKILSEKIKNKVLGSISKILSNNRTRLLEANTKDLNLFNIDDQAMYERLVINHKKIEEMIRAVREVRSQNDPINNEISTKELQNGLKVVNKTAPLGTIMIIYESLTNMSMEAAVLAFKANNKILLKGGKEAFYSNKVLENFWHQALLENKLPTDYIQLLAMNREETQTFLKCPSQKLNLVVPRGSESLIAFVKEYADDTDLVNRNSNNFLYIDQHANWEKTVELILNAKTYKTSNCNTVDKIFVNTDLDDYQARITVLGRVLKNNGISILVDEQVKEVLIEEPLISKESVWEEEFLDMKCCIGTVDSLPDAIEKINIYSGGHSATIMTTDTDIATKFMEQVECAVVYQNASTQFTDGGQIDIDAALFISTDAICHSGPLVLNELVTNKYFVYDNDLIQQ